MKLSVLFENAPGENKSLEYGHGLSILIEFDGRKILFDTASGPAFLRNAKRMGIDLSDLDAVMLSHSHYDHASGFRDLLEEGFEVPSLFVGKGEKATFVINFHLSELSDAQYCLFCQVGKRGFVASIDLNSYKAKPIYFRPISKKAFSRLVG